MANRFASYRDMLNARLFSSEANCLQYLLDVSILPTQKRCPSCIQWMMILPCPPTAYPDGVCWQCCNKRISLRSNSILSRRKQTYRQFIDLLNEFSRGSSISEAATAVGLSIPTVRSLFNEIRERMAEEITTTPKIGGPGRIVEVDEAKFGKRKYQRGRIVQGIVMANDSTRWTVLLLLVLGLTSAQLKWSKVTLSEEPNEDWVYSHRSLWAYILPKRETLQAAMNFILGEKQVPSVSVKIGDGSYESEDDEDDPIKTPLRSSFNLQGNLLIYTRDGHFLGGTNLFHQTADNIRKANYHLG
ncbi:hypothetical protein ACHWQZ_G013254 [Mnemiopsis leidyi]